MEKSHLPMPQRKKIPVLSRDSMLPSHAGNNNNNNNNSNNKNKNANKCRSSSTFGESIKSEPSSSLKSKIKDVQSSNSSKKNSSNFSAKHSPSFVNSSANDLSTSNTNFDSNKKFRINNAVQQNITACHQTQVQSANNNSNKNKSHNSDLQNSKTLKSFSKHMPQFAKDVLSSKSSKVQLIYQKLEKFKFENDLVAEEIEQDEDYDENESSPIYHELDPIGIQCSKHTYQSIGEIQEELSKLGSTFDMTEPHSAPPVPISGSPEPLVPCQSIGSTPVTPAKTKSNSKSFFSKMWQPKKMQKQSSSKECKFITSMPLLLPKQSPDCMPENQHSPSLVTFLGMSGRNQNGSLSQPGSANLEKSGMPSSSSSPHSHRVFTFEDIDIDNEQFINSNTLSPLDKMSYQINSPTSCNRNNSVKNFKSPRSAQNVKLSPLVLNSNKTSLLHSNNKCYATLMFPENPPTRKTCSKNNNCSKENRLMPFTAKTEMNHQLPIDQVYSTINNAFPSRKNKISSNHNGALAEHKMYPTVYSSMESVLSQDTLRSDSPIMPYSSSSIHRSPFSSPSCGIRMLEIRVNSRKSDSKSPSPSPEMRPHQHHHHNVVQNKDTYGSSSGQSYAIKSPPRVICKSPNKYMHTILEEDHGIDQSMSIEHLNVKNIFEEGHLDEDDNQQTIRSNESRMSHKHAAGSSEVHSSRSVSLSSDLFSSEDSVSCHTTDSELSAAKNDNDSVFVKSIDPYEKICHYRQQQHYSPWQQQHHYQQQHQQLQQQYQQQPQHQQQLNCQSTLNWVNDGISYKIINQNLCSKSQDPDQNFENSFESTEPHLQSQQLQQQQSACQQKQPQQDRVTTKTSKLPQSSKLQPPKFLTTSQLRMSPNTIPLNSVYNCNSSNHVDNTFQTHNNTASNNLTLSKQNNSISKNTSEQQTTPVNGKKSGLPMTSPGMKHASALKYSNQPGKIGHRKIISTNEPAPLSPRIQPFTDLVAVEIKSHQPTLLSPTRTVKPLSKPIKTNFGFVRESPSLVNASTGNTSGMASNNRSNGISNLSPRHCQTIAAPTRTLPTSSSPSNNFDSFPKSKTAVINSFYSKGSSSNSSGICEHNGSLSSSPTSSNSSMFSALDSENDGVLFSLRRDFSTGESRFRFGEKFVSHANFNSNCITPGTNNTSNNNNISGLENDSVANNSDKSKIKQASNFPAVVKNNILKSSSAKVGSLSKDLSCNPTDQQLKPSKLQVPRVNDVKCKERFNKILHGTFEPHLTPRSKSPKVHSNPPVTLPATCPVNLSSNAVSSTNIQATPSNKNNISSNTIKTTATEINSSNKSASENNSTAPFKLKETTKMNTSTLTTTTTASSPTKTAFPSLTTQTTTTSTTLLSSHNRQQNSAAAAENCRQI